MDEQRSILIADDEASFLESVAELFSRDGYDCTCARDADEAVEYLRQRRFDLMVADIRMPGNLKLRLVREAKTLAEGMPVILVTAYPSVDSAIASIDLPVLAYLRKPVDYVHMKAAVDAALERSRMVSVVTLARKRMATLSLDMSNLEKLLSSRTAPEPAESVKAFMMVTLQALAGSLSDLAGIATRSLFPSAAPAGRSAEAELHLVAAQGLLRHAIKVLEQTKGSFKSRQLAELRRSLQAGLADLPAAESALPAFDVPSIDVPSTEPPTD